MKFGDTQRGAASSCWGTRSPEVEMLSQGRTTMLVRDGVLLARARGVRELVEEQHAVGGPPRQQAQPSRGDGRSRERPQPATSSSSAG